MGGPRCTATLVEAEVALSYWRPSPEPFGRDPTRVAAQWAATVRPPYTRCTGASKSGTMYPIGIPSWPEPPSDHPASLRPTSARDDCLFSGPSVALL